MNKQQRYLFWTAIFFTLSAIAAHAYLTQHHLDLRYGLGGEHGLCSFSETVDCAHTATSPYSELFGIPVALLGALTNLALLALLLCYRYPLVSRSTQFTLTTTLKLLSLFIFLVSLVMGGISALLLQAFCPVCGWTYLASLVTMVAIWRLTPGKMGFSMFEVKLIPSLGVGVIFLGLLINHNLQKGWVNEDLDEFTQLQFEEWQRKPSLNITPAQPLIQGPEQAKMVMVKFADYLCGHCATTHTPIHKFLDQHPEVQFQFQAFPLDGACNNAIPQSEGTRCTLAQLVQCADQQDKAWETQDWVFNNQARLMNEQAVRELLDTEAEALGLDLKSLWSCVEAPESLETIRQQASVGNKLNITGTPTVYVNGKKISGRITVPLLRRIYNSLR